MVHACHLRGLFEIGQERPRVDGVDEGPLFDKVDAVTVPVPDLDAGLAFYVQALGHRMKWRNDETGQAGLALPGSDTELVLATRLAYEPNWLVDSADAAAERVTRAGGRVVNGPFDIPVGRAVVVADPFDNVLLLLDLSKGRYVVDESGAVTGVERE
jgi:predicted enzyme related to lactoylglutathione lyase